MRVVAAIAVVASMLAVDSGTAEAGLDCFLTIGSRCFFTLPLFVVTAGVSKTKKREACIRQSELHQTVSRCFHHCQ